MKTRLATMYPTSGDPSKWRLFVDANTNAPDEPPRFPGFTFPTFPTRQQRINALRELGFAPASQESWKWAEGGEEEEAAYGPMTPTGRLVVVALVPAAVKA